MNKKILVVDDDKAILDAMSLILEFEGYQTDLMTSGKGIINKVMRNNPAVILLDYSLSGDNGGNITSQLRSYTRFKNIPIILVSAQQNIAELAKKIKVTSYLPKPFSIDDLLRMVKQYILP